MAKAQMVPCEECGTGVIGRHMARHKGSAFCKRIRSRKAVTKSMFNELEVALTNLGNWADKVSQLSARLKEAIQ